MVNLKLMVVVLAVALAGCSAEPTPERPRGAVSVSCSGLGVTFGGIAGPLSDLVVSASDWGVPDELAATTEVEGEPEPVPTTAWTAAGRTWIAFETDVVVDDNQTVWTELWDVETSEPVGRLHDCALHVIADRNP